jgi:hypothetical protein
MTGMARFWALILSPATARFILALIALALAAYTLNGLMTNEIVPSNRDAFMLAIGLVLGLSTTAFGYYFGSTARGDDKATDTATGKATDPVHVVPELDLDGAQVL